MSAGPDRSQRFVAEAREHLGRMAAALMALERGDGDTVAHVAELLRSAHSIKGEAGFSGLTTIERLAHTLETALEHLGERRVAPTPDVIDVLLFVLDRVGALVDDAHHSQAADISEPLRRLESITSGGAASDAAPSVATLAVPPPRGPAAALAETATPSEFPISRQVRDAWQQHHAFLYGVKLDWFECERDCGLSPIDVAERLERAGTVLDGRLEPSGPGLTDGPPVPPLRYWAIVSSALGPEAFAAQLDIPCAAIVRLEAVGNGPRPAAPRDAPPPRPASAGGSLRIPVSLIDRMMGLAGELVLIRNQATHAATGASPPQRQLMRRLDSITNELQDAALRMRMQPVGTLFDRFPRLVRDLARQLGKQIDLEIVGGEVELDKTVLELLADPLTHLVRNCCDHGVESPEQRQRSGKPPAGRIGLSARQERGQIVVQVRDDGRGLDVEAIRRKALQQGLRGREELDRLEQRELFGLILLPGFSTAAQVTDLSGRGVGMDVVRSNLDQIGGAIEIDSTAGHGAAFTLRVPLTLAILPCLLLGSGPQRLAIPQRDVEEVVRIDPADGRRRIEAGDDEEVLRLRGHLLPVTRLAEVLARRQLFTAATRGEVIERYHGAGRAAPAAGYVVVLKVGSQRLGLFVDRVLGSEEIVVKPLHALLRPLAVFAGATILGDGGVALILSAEGLARHAGGARRGAALEPAAEAVANETGGGIPLLLFRSGPSELLAAPLSAVRRVALIAAERLERVGERELVEVDGTALNVLRADRFLDVSACPVRERYFLIMPHHAAAPVGLLASEIVDAAPAPARIDEQAYRADGALGSTLVGGQIAICLDLPRLVDMWNLGRSAAILALPAATPRRILVVEDTRFFRQMIVNYLEGEGYEVLVAENGSEGLARLAGADVDLVVSDVEMPVMDGLTFARRVRDEPRFDAVPLLALTSLAGEQDRAATRAAGFDAHLVKLDRAALLAAVQALLTSGRAALTRGGPHHA